MEQRQETSLLRLVIDAYEREYEALYWSKGFVRPFSFPFRGGLLALVGVDSESFSIAMHSGWMIGWTVRTCWPRRIDLLLESRSLPAGRNVCGHRRIESPLRDDTIAHGRVVRCEVGPGGVAWNQPRRLICRGPRFIGRHELPRQDGGIPGRRARDTTMITNAAKGRLHSCLTTRR